MGVRGSRAAWFLVAASLAAAAVSSPGGEGERRREALSREIGRLEKELDGLASRERGILGELERLGAEARLNAARLEEAENRLAQAESSLRDRRSRLEDLETASAHRQAYLSFRLREMYKAGPAAVWRRALDPNEDAEGFLAGLRYAAYLNRRDAEVLERLRLDGERLEEQRASLERERGEWARARDAAVAARESLARSRQARETALVRLRRDQAVRRDALEELRSAAEELSGLVDRLGGAAPDPELDMTRFRGLLDWPAAGKVRAGFGYAIHPRFRTRVPHPGLDIEAREGMPFRAVFEGDVVFASWLRGYGLTAIVDHGSGMLSVYAHASVLLVEEGSRVVTGERLGLVGDTGSLEGPFLYFELRRNGKPVDPVPWLRPG